MVFTQWRVVLHTPLSFGLHVASQSLHSLHTQAVVIGSRARGTQIRFPSGHTAQTRESLAGRDRCSVFNRSYSSMDSMENKTACESAQPHTRAAGVVGAVLVLRRRSSRALGGAVGLHAVARRLAHALVVRLARGVPVAPLLAHASCGYGKQRGDTNEILVRSHSPNQRVIRGERHRTSQLASQHSLIPEQPA